MARFKMSVSEKQVVRVETRDDKYYYKGDLHTLQLSVGTEGSTGWVQLSRSQALMVAESLKGLVNDLEEHAAD